MSFTSSTKALQIYDFRLNCQQQNFFSAHYQQFKVHFVTKVAFVSKAVIKLDQTKSVENIYCYIFLIASLVIQQRTENRQL